MNLRNLRRKSVRRVAEGSRLGTNKRYAASIDRRMDARITESETQGHEAFSLTTAELELGTQPLTKTPIPKPVRA
jgi:hypothetical protein